MAKAAPEALPGSFERPLIDIDLGWACRYGYRRWRPRVVHHDDIEPFDLRATRRAAGMFQATLAALLDTEPIMISRWERGEQPCPTEVRVRWFEACQSRGQRSLDTE